MATRKTKPTHVILFLEVGHGPAKISYYTFDITSYRSMYNTLVSIFSEQTVSEIGYDENGPHKQIRQTREEEIYEQIVYLESEAFSDRENLYSVFEVSDLAKTLKTLLKKIS